MDPNTPLTIATARYKTRPEAVKAFKTCWGAHHQGLFDHMALAVLTRGEDGQLQVERHDTTTKHLAWGGLAIGAALTVVCPPRASPRSRRAGPPARASGPGSATSGTRSPRTHPRVRRPAGRRRVGIIVVTVNPKQTDIVPLLEHPEKHKVIQTKAGTWTRF